MVLRYYRMIAGLLVLAGLTMAQTSQGGWFDNSAQEAAQAYRTGKYGEALEGFNDPYRRGLALYRLGRYNEASEAFAGVRRLDVRLDALYNFGNAHFMLGQYKEAAEAYKRVLIEDPSNADARSGPAYRPPPPPCIAPA